jgi:hypothetical protein
MVWPGRLGAVMAGLAIATSARAALGSEEDAPRAIRLSIDAPAECPGERAFFDQLHARAPQVREAVAADRAPRVRVELQREDGEIHGRLSVSGLDGADDAARTRDIQGPDCATVEASLAFVAAVALDPRASLPAASGGASPADPSPPAAASPSPTREAPATRGPAPAASSEPWRLSVGAAFDADVGLGPDPTFLPGLFLEVELPSPLARASARAWVGRGFARSVDTPAGAAQLTTTEVRVEACVDVIRSAPWRVPACAILETGALSGQADATGAKGQDRGFLELGAGLRPTWTIGSVWSVSVLAGGARPVARYRFYFAPDTTAYALAPLSAVGELSASARFW